MSPREIVGPGGTRFTVMHGVVDAPPPADSDYPWADDAPANGEAKRDMPAAAAIGIPDGNVGR